MAAVLNIKTKGEEAFVASMQRMSGSVGKFVAETNINLARANKETKYFNDQLQKGFGASGERMLAFGRNMFIGVTLPLGLLAKSASDAFAEFDALRRALATVEPTASGLTGRLKELREIAKMPGIGFQEAIQGDVRLRSVGISAAMSARILREFGNAIAMTGGGKAQLNEVTVQLGQMAAKGKVLAQDLRPIIENAPAVATALKSIFGTTSSEMIAEQLDAKGMSSTDMINQLLGALEKAPRVTGGWKNSLENLSDTLFVAKAEIFEVAYNVMGLQSGLDTVASSVEGFTEGFKGMSEPAQSAILWVTALTAGIPLLAMAYGGLKVAVVSLGTALSATNLIGVAVIATIGYLAVKLMEAKQASDLYQEAMRPLEETIKKADDASRSSIATLDRFTDQILQSKKGTNEFHQAKVELIKLNPKFKEILDADVLNIGKVKKIALETAFALRDMQRAKQLNEKESSIVKELESIGSINSPKSGNRMANAISMSSASQGQMSVNEALEKISESERKTIAKLGKNLQETRAELTKITGSMAKKEEDTKTPTYVPKVKAEKVAISKEEKEAEKFLKDAHKKAIEIYNDRRKMIKKAKEDLAYEMTGAGASGLEIPEMPELGQTPENDAWAENAKKALGINETALLNVKVGLELAKTSDEDIEKAKEQLKKLYDDFGSFAVDLGTNFISDSIADGFGSAISSLIGSLGNAMIQFGKQALIANNAFAVFKKLFELKPGGGMATNAALALIAGGAVMRGLNAKMPKLAEGGVVNGVTTAILGDNKSGKEMALPWEKTAEFASMIASNMGGVGGGKLEARISGNDLLILLDRAKRSK